MRLLLIGHPGLVMWKRTATMRRTRLLILALVGWACCLAVGESFAQQRASRGASPFAPAERGRKAVNMNAARAASSSKRSEASGFTPAESSGSELTYIAVIGAVKRPAVFETTQRSVPLGELIERAGGLTSKSLGTVCMMDRGRTRVLVNLDRSADQQIEHGQVVFVAPRAGSQPQPIMTSRQPAPDKLILLSGLSRGPLLFNIGNQSRTLGDLIVSLGQSPEMLDREEVTPAHPDGGTMDLGSVLVSNTVVHFSPEAVNQVGVQQALHNGFRFEPSISLDVPTPEPENRSPPAVLASPPIPQADPKPVDAPRRAPVLATPVPPVSLHETRPSEGSRIEAVGSSIFSDEPLPFPPKVEVQQETIRDIPGKKSDGRMPLFLPRAWQNSDDSGAAADTEESARKIERTSAQRSRLGKHIVTASAVAEDQQLSNAKPARATDLSILGIDEYEDKSSSLDASFAGPPTWMILALVVGIAAASVLVSRFVPRTEILLNDTAPVTESVATDAEVEQVPTPEGEQHFLQRLILNKVSLIEEEAILPSVERLHGASIGASRMVFHEAHEGGDAGPHFKVRAPGSTRDVELRLRRLLREVTSPTQSAELVHSSLVQETSASKEGPLERALRAVERGAV